VEIVAAEMVAVVAEEAAVGVVASVRDFHNFRMIIN
jgi:hypothetical protein